VSLAAVAAVGAIIAVGDVVALGVLGALGALALVATTPPCAADPLWQAEVHAGYGIAVGGSGARMSRRPSPLTLSALASFALDEDPPLWGYGGLVVETLDRNSAGAAFGIEVRPHGSRLRFSGGGVWLVSPSMLLGATASAGACSQRSPHIGLCGDLQITAYFTGDDLAGGRSVTQAQLVLGMVFDVL
jgi:hypothetical protein